VTPSEASFNVSALVDCHGRWETRDSTRARSQTVTLAVSSRLTAWIVQRNRRPFPPEPGPMYPEAFKRVKGSAKYQR
jgi:hypothetical protein